MKKKKNSLGQAGLASSKDKQSQARAAEDWEEAWLLQILQQDPNWASPVKREVGPQPQSLLSTHLVWQSLFPTPCEPTGSAYTEVWKTTHLQKEPSPSSLLTTVSISPRLFKNKNWILGWTQRPTLLERTHWFQSLFSQTGKGLV